ncbi:MAG: hypothetical protein JWQ11_4434 [Rhizobacter sp.]|nr:hypothetical protein [Rhizobacter sp.]
MNITRGTTPSAAKPASETFEEVDVPAIQAEIQERKLDKLPPENLFSREVAGQGRDDGVIDATVSDAQVAKPDAQHPQVVETTPGRPGSVKRR